MRFGIYLLLVLSLLPTVMKMQFSFGLHDTGADQKDVLFAPAIEGCDISVFILDKRTNFKYFDGQFKEALVFRQILFGFTRESLPFLTEYNTGFTHRADSSVIPIRAPPCFHKLNS